MFVLLFIRSPPIPPFLLQIDRNTVAVDGLARDPKSATQLRPTISMMSFPRAEAVDANSSVVLVFVAVIVFVFVIVVDCMIEFILLGWDGINVKN